MIPHEYIEELTRRTDIVELVGSYVQLKRKGRLYGGLCPFHSEKTPSFYVYPDTQSFYCFGCQAAGDAISFVKKINNISSGEAIKMLASRAGMPEPQEDDKTGRLRSRVLSMNKEAARFFHACLNSTVEEARQARAYWRRRGLDDKTIVRFGLGYAPNDGQALYQYLRDKGYNQQELDASGLFKRSQSGRIYCLFWKRVMTPIFDLRGNIIAFGGRVMDDSKPKYVNSPETLVYHKSETVFAMQIAKRSASRRFVLCEGYMDVISMQQAGIDTAVCACGTALTPGQVRIISEYADEVILSYDSDEAGQKATLRSLELFRNSPVKVGVLQIPGAKDPDEYIKKYGPERFQALLDGVGNALDFRLKRLRDQYDLSQDAQRLQYVKEAVEMLAERSNPTEQEVYAGRLAEETNISKTAILAQLGTAAKRAGARSGHIHKSLHHADHRTEKTDHRGAAGDGRQDRQVGFELRHFEVRHVLDGRLHVTHRTTDPADTLFDHTGDRRIGLAAKIDRSSDLAVQNIISDAVHEIHIELRRLTDRHEALHEDKDRESSQNQQNPHQPSAAHKQLPKSHAGLLRDNDRICGLQQTNHNLFE